MHMRLATTRQRQPGGPSHRAGTAKPAGTRLGPKPRCDLVSPGQRKWCWMLSFRDCFFFFFPLAWPRWAWAADEPEGAHPCPQRSASARVTGRNWEGAGIAPQMLQAAMLFLSRAFTFKDLKQYKKTRTTIATFCFSLS